MSDLAKVIADAINTGLKAQLESDLFGYWDLEGGTIDTREFSPARLSKHVTQAYREARTIRTVDELDALPEGSVVRLTKSQSWIYQRRDEGLWFTPEFKTGTPSKYFPFPLDLLWTPGDET